MHVELTRLARTTTRMRVIGLVMPALDKGAIQRRKVQQQTTEKVMTMSKDDWRPSAQKMMI